MPAIRALTVSVNYGDVLAVTLPRNMRHFAEVVVVTSPEDARTREVARAVPGVRLSVTNAFTRHGAYFNKGLAIEEAGFDFMGRHGRIAILDADILLPDDPPFHLLKTGKLYGCRRRILDDPSRWSPSLNWQTLPLSRDGGPIGFFQLFDADDPAIRDKRPWYDVSFAHAGGCDAYFMTHWPGGGLQVLDFEVLHIGPKDRHWFGTSREARDTMQAFIVRNGWGRLDRTLDRTATDRVGEIVERVEVPGYEPSGYELPFVQRAKFSQAHAQAQAQAQRRANP